MTPYATRLAVIVELTKPVDPDELEIVKEKLAQFMTPIPMLPLQFVEIRDEPK